MSDAIYEQTLKISVIQNGLTTPAKEILIRISRGYVNSIVIKVSEVDNYGFNYTCTIDHKLFHRMKEEQSLEITFDELSSQIVDLLKEVQREQMFLRLEAENTSCKMVFYEKARLKSLIFLTVDLNVTDQRELIDEMAKNIVKLKENYRSTSYQVSSLKCQLQDKDTLLNTALTTNKIIEKQIKKDLQMLENVFCSTLLKLERTVGDKLSHLSRKHLKLLGDVETIKSENKLKCESSVRLVNSMHTLRMENERNLKLIDDLRLEVNHLNILRRNAEEKSSGLQNSLVVRESEIDEYKSQIAELKKDLQDATMIIAQKTKTHDEIAKDLVQANSMLVSFNNQYDALAKEFNEARELIGCKERKINEQNLQITRVLEEFEAYKRQFNTDELDKVKKELAFTKQNLHELERQNKETVKLNGLLTRKLSAADVSTNPRNSWLPPSQRSNY